MAQGERRQKRHPNKQPRQHAQDVSPGRIIEDDANDNRDEAGDEAREKTRNTGFDRLTAEKDEDEDRDKGRQIAVLKMEHDPDAPAEHRRDRGLYRQMDAESFDVFMKCHSQANSRNANADRRTIIPTCQGRGRGSSRR
jgi:hypothetical protein